MSIIRELARLGNKIDSASTGQFLSKGSTTGSFGTISYTDLTGRPTTLDSSAATSIVDSAYIQARQSAAGGGGLDSALTTQLIDSSYIAARAAAGSSGYQMYEYTATQGQTTFQDSDTNGNVLSYSEGGALVFYNGVLLGASDITATSGSSIVLTTGADSGSHVAIAKWLVAGGGGSGASIAWGGDRALSYIDPYSTTVINYFDITTTGNAPSFGTYSQAHGRAATVSDTTKGLIAGGSGYINNISYNTIATTGNAADFGDLTTGRRGIASASDGTYGVFSSGQVSGNISNVIDYVTIANTGNASDFGDTSANCMEGSGVNDATRAVLSLGYNQSSAAPVNTLEYITIASTSNTTDFGDLTEAKRRTGSTGASDGTYGLFANGYTAASAKTNVIEYITVQTAGNATDFGDLLAAIDFADTTNNATRAVTVGGNGSSGDTNVIQYYTITTPGNSVDFGDLTVATSQNGATSGNAS